MINIVCKSLFNGNASVGSHILQEARDKNEDICIIHKKGKMTVRTFMFGKFFKMGNKVYKDKTGNKGTYTLEYIKFEEDK